MFLRRNKKNNVYPCKPQFYYIKVGFKRVKIIKVCFRNKHCFAFLNTYHAMGKFSRQNLDDIFHTLARKIGSDTSCKLSPEGENLHEI